METIPFAGTTEIIFISLSEGDVLLESIETACADHDILSGIILSGVAALKSLSVHYIKHNNYPPDDIVHTVPLPMEMSTISGIIADGIPHVHIGAIHRKDQSYGGHLEEGTIVAYRGELAIMKCIDADISRIKNSHGIPILRKRTSSC